MHKTLVVAVCCIVAGSAAKLSAFPTPAKAGGASRVTVEIDGARIEGARVTNLTAIQEEVGITSVGEKPRAGVPNPGKQKSGTLVITRTVTNDGSLRQWYQSVVHGKQDRRPVVVTVYNNAGQPMGTFNFRNSMPTAYSGPSGGGKAGMEKETIKLNYESVQWKPIG